MMWNILFLAFLYFIQGLPYGLQSRFLPVYFRTHGMSLTDISLFKLLLTPWMLKALWAPLVDKYGTKKSWLMWSMLGLIVTCFFGSMTSPNFIQELALILFLFNLLTSTQDIAVDGIAIQVLSLKELAYGNIAQVVGYKFGTVFSGGILTWLSEYMNWTTLFLGLMLIYILSLLFVFILIPSRYGEQEIIIEKSDSNKEMVNQDAQMSENVFQKDDNIGDSDKQKQLPWILHHFQIIINSPGTLWMILFVLLYKLGEQGALGMVPLFLIDKGISTSQVGFWTGVVGQVISIGGSVLGGWLISHTNMTTLQLLRKLTMLRILPLVIQFIVISLWTEEWGSYFYVTSVLGMSLMLLISGTVTTATFTMMMQCSQMAPASVQSTHYTLLATLEVLGKLTFSVALGSIADIMGYQFIFFLFILLTAIILPLFSACPRVFESANKNS